MEKKFSDGVLTLAALLIVALLGGILLTQSQSLGVLENIAFGNAPASPAEELTYAPGSVYRTADSIVFQSGTTLTLESGATLDLQSGATTDFSGGVDLDGGLLDLDADGDTSVQADTDDQIDIEISGSDDFSLTANTFTFQTGSVGAVQSVTNESMIFATINTIAYTNTTAKDMGDIPANADVVDVLVIITTNFDDTGTDVIDCGINGGDTDHYVDAQDVSSAAAVRLGASATMPYAAAGDVGGTLVAVDCVYTGQNANAAQGSATVYIFWALQ